MSQPFLDHISENLDQIRAEGLWKTERPITSPQSTRIEVGGRKVLNLYGAWAT